MTNRVDPRRIASGALSAQERKGLMLKRINEAGRILASEAAVEFGVSEDSIRRDLRDLADAQLVHRFHGGAARRAEVAKDFTARALDDRDPKHAIARAAAAVVPANITMLVDSDTTALQFVRALPESLALRIVTTSLDVAAAALDRPCIEVVLIGGRLNRMTRSATGSSALAALQAVRADLCVLGACGIDADLTLRAEDHEDAYLKSAMIKASAQTMVLATGSKLGRTSPFLVAPISDVTSLVTEQGADPAMLEKIQAKGPQILLALKPS
jgi:DeoR/GlpR family transcriptional regulator of sugar metabolism